MTTVLVPVCDVGIGTGTAAVADCVTRLQVRLTDPTLFLVGGTVCVRAEVLDALGGRWKVRLLDGGRVAWVRETADVTTPAGRGGREAGRNVAQTV